MEHVIRMFIVETLHVFVFSVFPCRNLHTDFVYKFIRLNEI